MPCIAKAFATTPLPWHPYVRRVERWWHSHGSAMGLVVVPWEVHGCAMGNVQAMP